MNRRKKIWQTILDILFPPLCLGCRHYLQTAEAKQNLLCPHCFGGIEIYETRFTAEPSFSLLAAASYHNQAVRNLIHCFKYDGFLAVEEPLKKILADYLEKINFAEDFGSASLIVPIPLAKNRLRERGFNQAEVIGLIVSRLFHLPLNPHLLERRHQTAPQTTMKNIEAREANLKKSMAVNEKFKHQLLDYRQIIIVDDVYTSGATIKEAARVLRQAGAKNLVALVVAKTEG